MATKSEFERWAYTDEQWAMVIQAVGREVDGAELTAMRTTIEQLVNNPHLGTSLGEIISRDAATIASQIAMLDRLKLHSLQLPKELKKASDRMQLDAEAIAAYLRAKLKELDHVLSKGGSTRRPNKKNAKPLAQALNYFVAMKWLELNGNLKGTPKHREFFEAVVKPVYMNSFVRNRARLSWSSELFSRYVAKQMRVFGEAGSRGRTRKIAFKNPKAPPKNKLRK